MIPQWLTKTAATAVFILLGFFSSSEAQFNGQLSTAENLRTTKMMYGGYVGIYEQGSFGAIGQARRQFGFFFDAGAKLGFISVDAGKERENGVLLGCDAKFRILDAAAGDNFDFSAGPVFEATLTSDIHLYSLGGNLIGSLKLITDSGLIITPYSRLALRIQDGYSDSFGLAFTIGTAFSINENYDILGELQIDEDFLGFIAGVNFNR